MILKKSKIKIPYIRLDFRIVRQSDARWCERTAVSHRLLLDYTMSETTRLHRVMWSVYFPCGQDAVGTVELKCR